MLKSWCLVLSKILHLTPQFTWIYSVLHLQCRSYRDTAVSSGTRSHQLRAKGLLGLPDTIVEIFGGKSAVVRRKYGGGGA